MMMIHESTDEEEPYVSTQKTWFATIHIDIWLVVIVFLYLSAYSAS
jgi:hypothetical protein